MNNENPFGTLHAPDMPPEKKLPETPKLEVPAVPAPPVTPVPQLQPVPAAPEAPQPAAAVQPAAVDLTAVKDGVVDALTAVIERQNTTIQTLTCMVSDLVAQVGVLKDQTEAAKAERESMAQATVETRNSLMQYMRTNALPHDVLKVLQTENEKMIRKLDVRPQSDILRGVRDLYVQMGRDRDRRAKRGEETCVEVLDNLRLTIQEDIFEDHGVEVLCSEAGVLFKPLRMTHVEDENKQRIFVPTADKELNMRVAQSVEIGFQFEKEILLKEKVTLFRYDPELAAAQAAAEQAAAELAAEQAAAAEAPAEEVPAEQVPAAEAAAPEAPAAEPAADVGVPFSE